MKVLRGLFVANLVRRDRAGPTAIGKGLSIRLVLEPAHTESRPCR